MKNQTNVYSLNVNQFKGTVNWSNLSNDNETAINLWLTNKDYIFTKVRLWLLNENNLVFLHEVPNNYRQNKIIYDCFINECRLNDWRIIESDYDQSYFKTVAIFNKNKDYNSLSFQEGKKTNRILIIHDKSKNILYVGIHIPSDDRDKYWDICLEQLLEIYEKYNQNNTIIFIGDTNIDNSCYDNKNKNFCTIEARYKKYYYFLNKCNLSDAWLKKNSFNKIDFIYNILCCNSNGVNEELFNNIKKYLESKRNENIYINLEDICSSLNSLLFSECERMNRVLNFQETFIGHTRIDKVLIKQNIDNNYYDILYDDEIRYANRSDHSAICLSILNDKFFEKK